MKDDPGETRNLYVENPDKVKELLALLRRQVADGRSTPGPRQENDVPVDIWKLDTMPGVDPRITDDYKSFRANDQEHLTSRMQVTAYSRA